MAKTDVKSAFRIIPIHPADYPSLGIRWNNMYYFDRALAMGLSSSCAVFESFSTALEWETRVNVMYPLTETCDYRHVSATVLRVYVKFPFTDS